MEMLRRIWTWTATMRRTTFCEKRISPPTMPSPPVGGGPPVSNRGWHLSWCSSWLAPQWLVSSFRSRRRLRPAGTVPLYKSSLHHSSSFVFFMLFFNQSCPLLSYDIRTKVESRSYQELSLLYTHTRMGSRGQAKAQNESLDISFSDSMAEAVRQPPEQLLSPRWCPVLELAAHSRSGQDAAA